MWGKGQRTALARAVAKLLLVVFGNLLIVSAGVIFIEGLASVLYLSRDLRRPLAERIHTRYDDLLGWVNVPNLSRSDMYGKGVWFRSNSQGFRNDRDFARAVPTGKTRIICSGDSFTLGYGVDNDHTWCHLLETINPGVETVNMGQAGYGVDQSYLWYKRDGLKLDHDLHLFTFIRMDFVRMQNDTFLGHGKPILRPSGAGLATDNVPVPRWREVTPWITENLGVLEQLRSVQLLRRVLGETKKMAEEPETGGGYPIRDVTSRIFRDLRDTARSRGAGLVLIYLPVLKDLENTAHVKALRELIGEESSKHKIPFIDLTVEFAALPKAEYSKFFIPRGALPYPNSAGHLNNEGNRFVAEKLSARLSSIPEVAALLKPNSARSDRRPQASIR
jgi:hypothetical protein